MPEVGQSHAVSLFVNGGGIKSLYAINGVTREVYVSIFNTVAWTAWKQVSYTTPLSFGLTTNSYVTANFSNCYKIGNIAVISLYLDVANLSGYDYITAATIPYNLKGDVIKTFFTNSGLRCIFRATSNELKINPLGQNITADTILMQCVVILDI